jgi:pyridoxamine 5'-phosphate oxidase
MSIDFTSHRLSYEQGELEEHQIPETPYPLLHEWVKQAIESEKSEAYAFYLATCGLDKQPAVRTLLMREIKPLEQDGVGLVFYSNYDSAKGSDLAHNPQAEALFYWPSLERQVRLTGHVDKVGREQSGAYFHTRPRDSQLAAWVSEPQSSVVANRKVMEDKFAELSEQYQDGEIPLPDFWGGYQLTVEKIEFWQGRPNRMHDRMTYAWDGEAWVRERLLP